MTSQNGHFEIHGGFPGFLLSRQKITFINLKFAEMPEIVLGQLDILFSGKLKLN